MPQDSLDRIELLKSEIGYIIMHYEKYRESAGDRIGWCLCLLIKYGAISEALEIHQQIVRLIDVQTVH